MPEFWPALLRARPFPVNSLPDLADQAKRLRILLIPLGQQPKVAAVQQAILIEPRGFDG
jgi:hypothetical protein